MSDFKCLYETYDNLVELETDWKKKRKNLQCIVSTSWLLIVLTLGKHKSKIVGLRIISYRFCWQFDKKQR
jgi:hypothetical protein